MSEPDRNAHISARLIHVQEVCIACKFVTNSIQLYAYTSDLK